MTNEEAIKVLRFVLDPREYPNGEKSKCYQYNLGAINKAIEALEKQIAKKPIDNHHCPSCETGLPHKGFTDEWCKCCFELDYCPRCGQAIDWSDDE